MDLLFRVTSVTPSDPPQVGDTDFQQHYTGVNRSMAWDELTPGIRQATEKFVLDYIGTEIYIDLATKYNAEAQLTTEQAKTLELIQDCTAYYTIFHVLPEKRSVLASLGVLENTPDGGSSPAAFPIYKEKLRGALDNGDLFLDRLLNYMEAQVKAGTTYFDLWKNSAAFKVKTCDFFRHTSELDEYLNIQKSRRSFISLVRFCKQIEEDVIKPILCDTLYAAVLIASPTTANQKLLPFIRKAVAYLGAAAALAHHRVVIDGDGFRVVSYTDGIEDRRNLTNNVHEGAVQALQMSCEEKGRAAVAKLVQFLEDNITDYPTYANSTCRIKPVDGSHGIRQGGDGIGLVLMG